MTIRVTSQIDEKITRGNVHDRHDTARSQDSCPGPSIDCNSLPSSHEQLAVRVVGNHERHPLSWVWIQELGCLLQRASRGARSTDNFVATTVIVAHCVCPRLLCVGSAAFGAFAVVVPRLVCTGATLTLCVVLLTTLLRVNLIPVSLSVSLEREARRHISVGVSHENVFL